MLREVGVELGCIALLRTIDTVGAVDAIGTLDAVRAVGAIGAIDAVDAVGAVGAVNAVGAVCHCHCASWWILFLKEDAGEVLVWQYLYIPSPRDGHESADGRERISADERTIQHL